MSSSLERLAPFIAPEDLVLLRKHFPNSVKFNMLARKGVFPYDYINDWTRLDETVLPSKKSFYSKLNNADISDAVYAHAQRVWDEFKISNLGDYLELYLQTDVLLLADVFENFRNVCLNAYSLDPAHYFTTPGLTWDAMLKMTKINLELLTDVDMLLFFERGIRGGISQCCNRYAKVNNRYMGDDYDASKPETFLVYWDANNLYGWAMSQLLPVDGFRWLDELEIDRLDVRSIPDDELTTGYILEVDLEYLHDRHKDLPFACEPRAPPGSKFKKLMTTLHDKTKSIIYYRNLKQCLEHLKRV